MILTVNARRKRGLGIIKKTLTSFSVRVEVRFRKKSLRAGYFRNLCALAMSAFRSAVIVGSL
jgi:hypothetical protein